MLKLDKVVKHYVMGENTVQALKGVDIEFRKNEFVSILGPSGCGKTTMLNIIGGLDRYTSGDLKIDGKSTKDFKDADWDAYRNRTIGFVFQNYNLISHQTVLDNVAIALTLSGVSLKERRERALKALGEVGIADQAHKKPNQLSGGQMQRVAIARALVNNPKIILADEPTGALDSQTSDQIMRILKDVSKDRLVIMVTHNGELAEQYSTRIVRLKDGEIIEDTNEAKNTPIVQNKNNNKKSKDKNNDEKTKMTSMSYMTALKLSFKNLLTKKTRTILTAIAGSIGIIGVALVLAISSGMNAYIDNMQREVLSGLPIEITQATTVSLNDDDYGQNNYSYPKGSVINKTENNSRPHWNDFSDPETINFFDSLKPHTLNDDKVLYTYETMVHALHYNEFTDIYTRLGSSNTIKEFELYETPDESLIKHICDVLITLEQSDSALKASMPADSIPLTLMIDQNNSIENKLITMITGKPESDPEFGKNLKFEDFLGKQFSLVSAGDIIDISASPLKYYETNGNLPGYNKATLDTAYSQGRTMYIDRIIRAKDSTAGTYVTGSALGFPSDLRERMTKGDLQSFNTKETFTPLFDGKTTDQLIDFTKNIFVTSIGGIVDSFMPAQYKLFNRLDEINPNLRATVVKKAFGIDATPNGVNIYAKDFESKEKIKSLLTKWNKNAADQNKEIHYSDLADMITGMIKSLLDIISIVLTAFAAISLVVSTIMIGIITYVSVVERTKEIGILRSIGARKKDISRVFNAETLIIGFTAGAIGIIATFLLSIPINIIVGGLTGVSTIAALPIISAGILVVISMTLTLIAGLIPSRIAAKKDPVIALRTE